MYSLFFFLFNWLFKRKQLYLYWNFVRSRKKIKPLFNLIKMFFFYLISGSSIFTLSSFFFCLSNKGFIFTGSFFFCLSFFLHIFPFIKNNPKLVSFLAKLTFP